MDISTTFQTWMNVLRNPNEATFEQEGQQPNANLTTALIWIIITGVVTAIMSYLVGRMALTAQGPIMLDMFEQMDVPPEVRAQMQTLLASGVMNIILGASTVASVIVTPIIFLISVGLRHFVARALGGDGVFGRYAYLIATFTAPLAILRSLVGFIPLLGACVSLIAVIYELVLSYYATKAEQKLSAGRAIVVVLAPLILLLALVSCVVISFLTLVLITNVQ